MDWAVHRPKMASVTGHEGNGLEKECSVFPGSLPRWADACVSIDLSALSSLPVYPKYKGDQGAGGSECKVEFEVK